MSNLTLSTSAPIVVSNLNNAGYLFAGFVGGTFLYYLLGHYLFYAGSSWYKTLKGLHNLKEPEPDHHRERDYSMTEMTRAPAAKGTLVPRYRRSSIYEIN